MFLNVRHAISYHKVARRSPFKSLNYFRHESFKEGFQGLFVCLKKGDAEVGVDGAGFIVGHNLKRLM